MISLFGEGGPMDYYELLEQIAVIDRDWRESHDASVAAGDFRELLMGVFRYLYSIRAGK